MQPNVVNELYSAVAPGPNYITSKVPVQSDINIEGWKKYAEIVNEVDPTLIPQLQYGFSMGINNTDNIDIPVTNHVSARENYKCIDQFIIQHYDSQAILGPYYRNPLPVHAHPSPFQVAESASGKQRAVLDMSYPQQHSINSAIPSEWEGIGGFEGEFRLPTHDKVCAAILQTEDPLMFVSDLKAYYMQLPSDWADTPYLCFTWRNALWLHRRLPFGCRSSCLHAQRVTEAIVKIYRKITGSAMEGYVDDFMSIVRRIVRATCYIFFHTLLEELGMTRSLDKCYPPDIERIFLGLLYNLAELTLSLPADKANRAVELMQKWQALKTCLKSQVQSLLGHLNHMASVIHAGRPFMSKVVDLLRAGVFPAPVTQELKLDLQVWCELLQSDRNRKAMILQIWQ